MDRRDFIFGTASAALLPALASAQEAYPTRAITILNAFPPGGANDLVTRPMASALEPIFKQPVVVETKAGAAGAVGAQVAATAKPDGYTLLSHNNGLSGYAEVDKLFGRQPKTTRVDFIPLARLSADPVLLLVNEQQPWKTLEEFIADAKKRPEKIIYSSGGFYGASHLPVAMIEHAANIKGMRHLPTAGGGPAITAVLGNNAQMTTQTVQAALSHIRAGKLRALASYGTERSKALPDVPTMKEKGFDLVYYLWVALFAPKGTPAPIVSTLTGALDKAATSETFTSAMANIGLEQNYQPAAEFAKFWDEDARRAEETIRRIGKVG
jgi:tripartite-type tricarboxylate transporter receptor subunit TctC